MFFQQLEMLGWKGEDISPNSDGSIERFIVSHSEKKRTPNEGSFVKGMFKFLIH